MRKNGLLKRVMAVAVAAAMALGTPVALSPNEAKASTITAEADIITASSAAEEVIDAKGWWSTWSNYYKVSGDFDVTFTLVQEKTPAPTANYHTPTLAIASDANRGAAGYKEYLMRRTDNFCNNVGGGDNKTTNGVAVTMTSRFNWDTFLSDMAGASHVVNVKRTTNNFVITDKITKADSSSMTDYVVSFTDADIPKDLRLFWTGEQAKITISSYVVNSGTSSSAEKSLALVTNDDAKKSGSVNAKLFDVSNGTATAVTDKKINYASSDSKVATVSEDGTVTAVSNGKAVITSSCEGYPSTATSVTVTTDPKTVTISGDKVEDGNVTLNVKTYKDG